MSDLWGQLPWESWPLLVTAAVLAGLVRGFTGFGTALVYLPLAGQVLEPFALITSLIALDLLGPLPAVPRALREADLRDVARMGLGLLVGVPMGVYLLSSVSPLGFRYALSVISVVLLVLLVSGLRYRGPMTPPLMTLTGAAGGFMAGIAGLPGPPAILLYMASSLPVQVIRANLMLYLILADLCLLALFWVADTLPPFALLTGLAIMPAYLLATILGSHLFDPAREKVYRWTAYVIIAGSALTGLPLFD